MILGPPVAHYENFTPAVHTIGDSTANGVGAATLPAFRYGLYTAFANLIRMVGSQSYGGTPDVLGVNASHDGHNSQTIQNLIDGTIATQIVVQQPDLVLFIAGINDVIAGDSAVTILARLSDALDQLWARRYKSWMQICIGPPFKPLNGPHDTVVQAVLAGMPAMIAGKSFASHVTLISGTYDGAGGADGMNDDYHPNDTGYTRIAAVLAAALATPILRARPVAIT